MRKETIIDLIKILSGLVLLFIVLILFLHYAFELGSWQGTSYEKYMDRAWKGDSFIELPADVQDFRFHCTNYGVAAYSEMAFTLTDVEYNNYLMSLERLKTKDKGMFYDPYGLVGKTVPETFDFYDERGNFVGLSQASVKKIIKNDIEDYTIVYYEYYLGAGGYTYAIASKPDSNSMFVYVYGSN